MVKVYKIYSSISQREKTHDWHKSRTNDVTLTDFNCKAVEVTEIEKLNGHMNYEWRRRFTKATMFPIIAAIDDCIQTTGINFKMIRQGPFSTCLETTLMESTRLYWSQNQTQINFPTLHLTFTSKLPQIRFSWNDLWLQVITKKSG